MSKASDFFSAGGGLPIGQLVPINSPDVIFTDPISNNIWLRTGSVSNDYDLYPDANLNIGAYFEEFFSYGAESTSILYIVKTDNYIYAINGTGEAYQYSLQGVYNSVVKDITTGITSGLYNYQDFAWDGTNIWAVARDNNPSRDFLVKYDEDLQPISSFDITSDLDAISTSLVTSALAVNSDGVWVYTQPGNDFGVAFKFNTSGVYQSVVEGISNFGNPPDSAIFFEDHFWVLHAQTKTAYQYSSDWRYTGISWNLALTKPGSDPDSFTPFGESVLVNGNALNIIATYDKAIGSPVRADEPDANVPYYIRIK